MVGFIDTGQQGGSVVIATPPIDPLGIHTIVAENQFPQVVL